MRPHKKLNIWEEAMMLIEELYRMCLKLPKDETYGISAQMKRASISVASNIAEGCARNSNKEKIQFFMMARGSLSELDAQIEICLRLNFIQQVDYDKLLKHVEKTSSMLQGLIDSRRHT
jgi:four helix bundle protein